MKKHRIFAYLLVLVICSSMLCVSCDKNEISSSYNLSDIMNSKWKMEREGVIFQEHEIVRYNHENFVMARDGFAVYSSYEDYHTYYIYSASSQTPIATISTENNKNLTFYDFSTISSEYLAVLSCSIVDRQGSIDYSTQNRSKIFNCTLANSLKYTLAIYDSNGNVNEFLDDNDVRDVCSGHIPNFDSVYKGEHRSAILYRYNPSNLIKDVPEGLDIWDLENKVYRFDGEGKIRPLKEFDNSSKPSIENMKKFGNNYLETVNGVYSVYDKDLNKTIEYKIPEGRDVKAFVLVNGNLLVQYLNPINEGEKIFDVKSYAGENLELVTLLVNGEGTVEVEDADYIIDDIMPSVAEKDGQKFYSDIVENLALVYSIDSKKNVDYSSKKLVLVNNEGVINGKVNIKDNFVDFPKQYTDDYYSVKIDDENYAIYDKDNLKVSVVNAEIMQSKKICDEYFFVDEKLIYNSVGEKICDLSEKKDLEIKKCGNTVIAKYMDNGFNYDIFIDGKFVHIGSTADPSFGYRSSPGSCIQYSDALGYSEKCGYYIVRRDTVDYYYNTKGQLFMSSKNSTSLCMFNDDALVMRGLGNYYMFKIK